MLEKIINSCKKKILPFTLGLSILPLLSIPSQPYINEVTRKGKIHTVEVCEDKKIIQVPSGSLTEGKIISIHSFVEHERVLLEKLVKELEYGVFQLVEDSYKQSKVLSKKINQLAKSFRLEDFKVHPLSFVFHGMPVKALAAEESREIRAEVVDYLKELEDTDLSDPIKASKTYRKLLYYKDLTENASRFVRDIRLVTKLDVPFKVGELKSLDEKIRRDVHYLNLNRLEKTFEEIRERTKEKLRKSKQGKDYFANKVKIAKKKRKNPFEGYVFVRKNPKIVYYDSFNIPVYDKNGKLIEKRGLDLIVKQSCIRGRGYNLRLELIPQNKIDEKNWEGLYLLDNLKSMLSLVHPSNVEVGKESESALMIKAKNGKVSSKFKEIQNSKRDKIKIAASKEILDKALSYARGNITRIRNVTDFASRKLKENERANIELKIELLQRELRYEYLEREIKIFPTENQSSRRIISIPIENADDRSHYLVAKLGIRNWSDKFSGQRETVIEIPHKKLQSNQKGLLKWVIPSEWIKTGRTTKILLDRIGGRDKITPNDHHPEYTTIRIGNEKYSFLDQEFFDTHSINGNFPAYPISLSQGFMHFELTTENRSQESYVEGVYFGGKEEISEALIKRSYLDRIRLRTKDQELSELEKIGLTITAIATDSEIPLKEGMKQYEATEEAVETKVLNKDFPEKIENYIKDYLNDVIKVGKKED